MQQSLLEHKQNTLIHKKNLKLNEIQRQSQILMEMKHQKEVLQSAIPEIECEYFKDQIKKNEMCLQLDSVRNEYRSKSERLAYYNDQCRDINEQIRNLKY